MSIKIQAEITDEEFFKRLDMSMGKKISELTADHISGLLSEVVDKKLQRLDMEKILREAAKEMFRAEHGKETARFNNKYGEILHDEASKILINKIETGRYK